MSSSDQQQQIPVIRRTLAGPVEGLSNGGVERFLGIPYAAPPVGELRFALPALPNTWSEPRAAIAHGPTPPQLPYRGALAPLFPTIQIPGDEYLNLNIWAPAHPNGALRPVLVWFHGGELAHGSNALELYDGTRFARDAVVFVSVNYRLGVEGFSVLQDAAGNLGLADQIAALEWVKANIEEFGGDPHQVCVCGHGAGGSCVAALLVHPRASSLFCRAIINSAPLSVAPSAQARRMSTLIARDLGVGATREEFSALSPQSLLASLDRLPGARDDLGPLGTNRFALSVDGALIPQDPYEALLAGAAAEIPVLIGTTVDEARLWITPNRARSKIGTLRLGASRRKLGISRSAVQLYKQHRPQASPGELWAALAGDKLMRTQLYNVADARHRAQSSGHRTGTGTDAPRVRHAGTYVYEFAWPSPVAQLGAAHGVELPFVFENLAAPEAQALVGPEAPATLASTMHEAWVCFATMGVPGWAAWDLTRPVKTFDGQKNPVVFAPRDDESEVLG